MLLVRWAVEVFESCVVIFIPISIRKQTNRPETILQALAAHLASVVEKSLPSSPVNPTQFHHDKVREYLKAYGYDQEKLLLIILDGLDEAVGFAAYEKTLFPKDPIPNVKLVVSARLTANAPDVRNWLNRLGWNTYGLYAADLTIPALEREGLRDVLQKMGGPLSDLAGDVDMVAQLLRLTLGDPLLVGLYVEDLRRLGDTVACLKPEDLKNLSPGFDGYFRKWFEDQKKLWQDNSVLREKKRLGVLAILACALGPLKAGEIKQLFKIIHDTELGGFSHIIDLLERFVIGNPDADGYTLSHPKLGEFLTSTHNRIVDTAMISNTRQGFLLWGKKTLAGLNERRIKAEAVSEYLLFYHVHHLVYENAPVAEFTALVEDGWRRAWYAYEGGYYGFANNISIALKQVKKAAEGLQKKRNDLKIYYFAEQFRCVFSLSSIHNIGSNISGKLLKLAVECDILSDRQAINLISLKPDQYRCAFDLIEIAGTVQRCNLTKLLEAARNIGDEDLRANALIGLTPHLSEKPESRVVDEALEAIRNIEFEWSRSRALRELAPHLPETLKAKALEVVKNIESEKCRTHALIGLAQYLPEDLKAETLETARNVRDKHYRALALSGLAPHLYKDLKSQVVSEAFEVAQNINGDLYRASVLSYLAPHLSEELKVKAMKYWLETANCLKREDLLKTIPPLINTTKNYIAREEMDKISKTILEISKWWP
jgi:hypothetical protein